MIKKTLTIAAVALVATLAAPRAEAGHSSVSITYRSGHASCGCPTYSQRFFRGYDCYRRPIYNYRRLALRHGNSCRHRAVHNVRHNSRVYHTSRRPLYPPVIPRSYIRGGRGYGHNAHYRRSSRGRSCR